MQKNDGARNHSVKRHKPDLNRPIQHVLSYIGPEFKCVRVHVCDGHRTRKGSMTGRKDLKGQGGGKRSWSTPAMKAGGFLWEETIRADRRNGRGMWELGMNWNEI